LVPSFPESRRASLRGQVRNLNAAIGHVVDPECGHIARDQASDFEFVISLKDELGVAGEKSGL